MGPYCSGCIYDYYEPDTNWGECKHPEYNEELPDKCPGYYLIEDAKADAKLSRIEKGK